jgi:hypothetical protein
MRYAQIGYTYFHAFGTSCFKGFGYKVEEPLVLQPACFDNEQTFFELIPAVLQNNEWMYGQQGVHWASTVAFRI